jgi:hypothetical protein
MGSLLVAVLWLLCKCRINVLIVVYAGKVRCMFGSNPGFDPNLHPTLPANTTINTFTRHL